MYLFTLLHFYDFRIYVVRGDESSGFRREAARDTKNRHYDCCHSVDRKLLAEAGQPADVVRWCFGRCSAAQGLRVAGSPRSRIGKNSGLGDATPSEFS